MDKIIRQFTEWFGGAKTKRRRNKVLAAFMAGVVFCTTYALILPAITLESEAFCGYDAHHHDADCYEKVLICDLSESEAHTHTDACFDTTKTLSCGKTEHTHSEDCYEEVSSLVCAVPEHSHDESCYDEYGDLICGMDEHIHGDDCYEVTRELVCGQEEHAHMEACYDIVRELSCGISAETVHKHTDACYETKLVCTKEEHEHDLSCYSDPNADLEDESVWTRNLPDGLTGVWADDLVAVAESQLGYKESANNYQVVDNDVKNGYTRYGAWYGDPYGDWCAMFISFCLNYAGIPEDEVPYEASCPKWVDLLTEKDMYFPAGEYTPKAGDIVFFEKDGNACHVGIVKDADEEKLYTIEGNSTDMVCEREYEIKDSSIMGYGVLPENPAVKEEAAEADKTDKVSDSKKAAKAKAGTVSEPLRDAVTDNLRPTLATATITIDGNEVTGNNWTVYANEPYTIHLEFREVPSGNQFAAETGQLVYKLPDSFNVTDTTGGSIDFTYDTGSGMATITGCTYTYDPDSKCIIVTLTDEAKEKIGESGKASFHIDITGEFSSDADRVEFSDTIVKDVDIDVTHDLDIQKTGYYDPSDDKVHYTLAVHSTGVSTNVIVSDSITGSALTMDPGSIFVSGNSGTVNTTENGNTFTTTIDHMNHDETVTIEYTASVDHTILAGKTAEQITASEIGNAATVQGDNDPPETVTHVVAENFDSVTISKNAAPGTVNGNTCTIPWTITYNPNQAEPVGGTTITDHITGEMADKTKYTGAGITVKIYDGDTLVDTVTRTWQQLSVTDSSKSWSYTLPEDGGHAYKYVITYNTATDVSGQIKDTSVGNSVDDGEHGHTGTGTGVVVPGDDGVTIDKTHSAVTPEAITWDVTIGVPVSGLTSAVVTDTLPYVESYHDTIKASNISVSGLLPGETYTVDLSDPTKAVITFYQDTAKTIPGLQASENRRNVVVTLITDNDPDWVAQYGQTNLWQATHKNTVRLDANGEPFTDEDSAKPITTGIHKSGEPADMVTIDGVDYPVFKYMIDIYGLSDSTTFPLTITDTFDTSLLKYYRTDGIWIDWYGGTFSENCTDGVNFRGDVHGQLEFQETSNGFTVDIPRAALQPWSGWSIERPRRLIYYLIVKDQDALTRLLNQSMDSNDFAVSLHNTASDGNSSSESTVDYQYPGVDKELLGVDENSGIATYKIVLNPNKVQLNNGNTITMTDSFENLSVDFSSVRVTLEDKNGNTFGPYNTSSVQDKVTWNYRGHTGTFNVPDETKVTITYSARVTREGAVTIKNTASMLSFSETVTHDATINSSGAGSLEINYIWLFKHEGGDMTKPINGVEFTLVDSDGDPVLYPSTAQNGKAGQPITFTTDTRTTDDEATLSGYARIFLSEQEDGISFQKGVTYYLQETKPAEGYQRDDIRYSFTIADHPDYNKYEYHIGDVLRVNNWPQEGVIKVKKTITGAENLTDAQKDQITFTLTGTPSDGTDFTSKTFNYGEFTSGEYLFEQLAPGTYTVTETGYVIGRYEYEGTTATATNGNIVSGSNDRQATFTITQEDIDNRRKCEVAFENHYVEPVATSLTVKKTDNTGQLHLYDATFQILKKVGDEYKPLEEAEGTQTGAFDEKSTFTIDYENRKTGVKITGLSDGDYMIKELTAPSGYVKTDAEITFSVQDGTFTYTNTQTNAWTKIVKDETNNTFTLEVTVKNELEHTYTITKVAWGNLDAKLAGAEFTVYEYHADGSSTPVTTMTTDENGQIQIDDRTSLDANHNPLFSSGHAYFIQETKAPVGYVLPQDSPKYFFYFGNLPSGIGAATLANLSANKTVLNLANGPQQLVMENTPKTTELTVSKDWLRVDGNDTPCPDDITQIQYRVIQIASTKNEEGTYTEVSRSYYPDENTVHTVARGSNQGAWDTWTGETITGLPTGKSDGGEPIYYTYAVEEIDLEGYLATYGDDKNHRTEEGLVGNDNKVTIFNSPEPTSITVHKVWADGDPNHNGQANKAKVKIVYRDNTVTGGWVDRNYNGHNDTEVYLNDSNNWSYTWDDLDPGTKDNPRYYYVEEYTMSGYSPSYSVSTEEGIREGEITVINKKIITNIAVFKQWLDEDGSPADVSNAEPVQVKLYRQKGVPSGHAVTIREYEGDSGQDRFVTTYKKYVPDGGSLTGVVPSWHPFRSCVVTSGTATINYDNTSCTISNIHSDITVELHRGWTTIDYPDYVDPPVALNEETEEQYGEAITLSDGNNWYKEWSQLPTDAGDGQNWYYYVKEDPVSGYTTSYDNNGGIMQGVITVTNQKIPPIDFSFTKQWKNNNGGIAPWPADIPEITVTLSREEDSTFSKTFTLSKDGEIHTVDGITCTRFYNSLTENYEFTFSPLEPGYTYYVSESPLDKYTASYADTNYQILINQDYALDDEYIINIPESAVALPATGGPGAKTMTITGFCLLAAALGMLLYRKRSIAAPSGRSGGSGDVSAGNGRPRDRGGGSG